MSARVYVDAVEGNDVWLVWRATLPDGSALTVGKLASANDTEKLSQMTVSIIHESSLGNSKEVIQIFKGMGLSTGEVSGTVVGNGDFHVWDVSKTTLWGGLDDTGYTIEARIRSDGADYANSVPEIDPTPGYILEGGNTYAVEVSMLTTDWGTVTVSAQIQVDYLHTK